MNPVRNSVSSRVNRVEEARKLALEVLDRSARPSGFFASGLPGGYEATWARDSMITSLGASLAGGRYQTPFRRSLELLSKNQSRHGQIPNAVGDYNAERRSSITFNSIDSTLWYLIGHRVYAQAFNDRALLTRHRANIKAAFAWLEYQDPNEDGLIVQQPTMDWMDAMPHKYGRVLNTQALYYQALRMHGMNKSANRLRRVINGDVEKYLSLYDPKRGYYLPWIWKNHDGEREGEYWFDTLGNLLAILTGLAPDATAKRILGFIESKAINRPYPAKALWPPLKRGDKRWQAYFLKLGKNSAPFRYLNGGVWPFIGGFYVAALVKAKQFAKAKRELEHLAGANIKGAQEKKQFNEWLHGRTGEVMGNPYQAWSAGIYVFAYECVKRRKVEFF